jgi:hypothetical protein
MIEKQVEKSIMHYLAVIGAYAVKVQSGMLPQSYKGKNRMIHLAPQGTPDIIALFKGNYIGIEVKKDDKEVQKWIRYPYGAKGNIVKHDPRIEAQKETGHTIAQKGGVFIICSSVDELERDLKTLKILE